MANHDDSWYIYIYIISMVYSIDNNIMIIMMILIKNIMCPMMIIMMIIVEITVTSI